LAPGPAIGERKQGVPTQEGSVARLLPPPSGGTEIIRLVAGGRPYAPPRSGPACPVEAVSTPSFLEPEPPPPFPLEHATQGLTALRRTESLGGTAAGACEVFVAARAIAGKFRGFFSWALTLALRSQILRGRVGVVRLGRRDFGVPALGAAAPIALVLGLSPGAAVGGLTIALGGASLPPPPRRGLALGATVSGLGVGGSKALRASLEQTLSLAGPMSPLTGARIAARWRWAQGSCELPTAKPRTRGPSYSAPRRLY
jgi:hypothetical protein